MAWILDEYSKFHGYSPAVVTGKPTVSIYINTAARLLATLLNLFPENLVQYMIQMS
jgi:glutamate dehydrogenase/leucine dehydrogenase